MIEKDLIGKSNREVSVPEEWENLRSAYQSLQEVRNALISRVMAETSAHDFQSQIVDLTPKLAEALSETRNKFYLVAWSPSNKVETLEEPIVKGVDSWVGRKINLQEEGITIGLMNQKDWQRKGMEIARTDLTIRTSSELITAYFWTGAEYPHAVKQEREIPFNAEEDELAKNSLSSSLKEIFIIRIKNNFPERISLEAGSAAKAYAPEDLHKSKRTTMQMAYRIEWGVGNLPQDLQVIHGRDYRYIPQR